MNQTNIATIRADINKDAFCLEVDINDRVNRYHTKMDFDHIDIEPDFFLTWMLNCLKPLFFNMPVDDIGTVSSKAAYERFGEILEIVAAVARSTNEVLRKHNNLGGIAKENKRILYFNVDEDARLRSFFEQAVKTNSKDVLLYRNMTSGFNSVTRTWEPNDIPLSVEDFINLIRSEGVKKIISVNHYLVDQYLRKLNLYIMSLFHLLGVEYIILDSDPWDLSPRGYLMKGLYNCNSFVRFSSAPILSEYWDIKYELDNVSYIGMVEDYANENRAIQIDDDYDILILTNARLENIRNSIGSVIFLLDHMNDEYSFSEFHLWYMSLRHMILSTMALDEPERLYYNSRLFALWYNIAQVLKYEVIESINTKRDIQLYGDAKWRIIFPEYYRKYLNSKEIDNIFAQNRHIYLLLNGSLSYLDASGTVYDAIKRNVPFVNMPTLGKTKSYSGFRHIEYSNKAELNFLIDNIKTVWTNEELRDSINACRSTLTDNMNFVHNKILSVGNSNAGEIFEQERKAHNVLLVQMVEDYISKNEPFLRETFQVLISGQTAASYDFSRSKYLNRRYMQRIIRWAEENK
ncbi:MAG: hypothetical protein V1736_12250 [Pseudomonadota bacterium]